MPIILAGGKGTRLNHELPKPLVPVHGKAMVLHVLDACGATSFAEPVVSLGHQAEHVAAHLPKTVRYAISPVQRGTAKAVDICRPHAQGRAHDILILFADSPLWTSQTLEWFIDQHQAHGADLSIGTVSGHRTFFDDRARIVRKPNGALDGIRKIKECSPAELELDEYNGDIFCCRDSWLWEALDLITSDNSYAEYNLSDIIAISLATKRCTRFPYPIGATRWA